MTIRITAPSAGRITVRSGHGLDWNGMERDRHGDVSFGLYTLAWECFSACCMSRHMESLDGRCATWLVLYSFEES